MMVATVIMMVVVVAATISQFGECAGFLAVFIETCPSVLQLAKTRVSDY